MRDIKFRGKRIDNGEWVYGYYLVNQFYHGQEAHRILTLEHEEFAIIPETVGQFTGLKDKEGNDIYEGDVLIAGWHWEDGFLVDLSDMYFHYAMLEYALDEGNIEIKGNIHDNPEML